MPVLPKVTRVMVLRGHNLADRMAAARAKLPLTPAQNTAEKASQLGQSIPGMCSNRSRQMKSKRASMQGEITRRLATYLGLALQEVTQGG